MITVKFFAYYRDPEFAGCKEILMETPSDTTELGNLLGDRFGERFRGEFFAPDGGIGERTILMVNGRNVAFLGGARTPLRDGDIVQVFPVVAGG